MHQKVKEALQRSRAFDEIHVQHPIHSKATEAIALKKCIMCRLGAEINIIYNNILFLFCIWCCILLDDSSGSFHVHTQAFKCFTLEKNEILLSN